jgi:uncharacterized protein (DUF1778 family)
VDKGQSQETTVGEGPSEEPGPAEMARLYASGKSIRAVALATGRSYGYVHRALKEAGVDLRGHQHHGPERQAHTDRIGLRASAEQTDIIREAAAIEGKTVSAFLLETGASHAREVIADHRDLVLSAEALEVFYTELEKPAHAVPELVDLFRRPQVIPQATP